MSCRYSEKDIALFVEGDLPPLRRREVEVHFGECETCSGIAEELRESQAMLRTLRQDTVGSAALASVRERVLIQLGSIDSSGAPVGQMMRKLERWIYAGFRPRYALTGVVLGAVVSAGVWYALNWPVKAPEIVRWAVRPPVVDVISTPGMKVSKTTKIRRHKKLDVQPKVVTEESRQVAIKLFTDDPNIVIYWLVDQKRGDE
ncbi:MAG TPA: hypothetical protein VE422_20100 [Terriglobia bacterium]|nr:hypothetical protein [Terriglobia bacterium]